MLQLVVWKTLTDVSEELTVSIIRVKIEPGSFSETSVNV
jgi:hypothetical protein